LAITLALAVWPVARCADTGGAAELNRQAVAFYRQSRFDQAIAALERSLAIDPRQAAPLKLLGLCYQVANRTDEAQRTFLQLTKLAPKDGEAWFYLGRSYYLQNFFDRALPALETALRLSPRDARAWECLGLTREANGETDRALEAYQQAVRWNGQGQRLSPSPHLSYGMLLYKLDRLEEGEKQLARAVELDPGDWNAHFELGKLLFRAERLEAAEQQLKLAAAAGSAGPEEARRIQLLLAQVHFRMGRNEEGREVTPAHTGAETFAPIVFTDIAKSARVDFVLRNHPTPQKYQIETMAGGVAVIDYNNDGLEDIYFVNGASIPELSKTTPAYWNRLYRNNGDGTFTDVTAQAGVAGEGYDIGAAVGDYDNDGWEDLFVTGVNRNILYHNNGDGTFTDVTEKAGLGHHGPGKPWSIAAGWFDFDNDGKLDLFVSNYCQWDFDKDPFCGLPKPGYRTYCHPKEFRGLPDSLYRNNGDGTFTDVSVSSGIAAHIGKGMGLAFADYDGDGRTDVFVANDTVQNFLFHNDGGGRFTEVGLRAGVGLNENGIAVSSMGADFRDIDNDGAPDIFVTALSNETFSLFRNTGRPAFRDITQPSGLGVLSLPWAGWSTGIFDLNNDGLKDIFAAGSHVMDNEELFSSRASRQPNHLFVNLGGARFADASAGAGPDFQRARFHRGCAFADFDNDGRMDVAVSVQGEPAEILRNVSGGGHHWLELRLRGRTSNRDGIGARVKLTPESGPAQYNQVSTSVGYASSSTRRVHFGLGQARKAARIEIRWPSGKTQILEDVPADRLQDVTEPD
jgi:tetratricopeptide (TPR) repeat protein